MPDGRPRMRWISVRMRSPMVERARSAADDVRAVAAAEADRGGELLGDGVELRPRALGATHVVELLRLLQLRAQRLEPLPVRRLGRRIEDLQAAIRPAHRAGSFASPQRQQVERVELPPGLLEERGEVMQALGIPHACAGALVGEQPVVPFLPEDRATGYGVRTRVARIGRRGGGDDLDRGRGIGCLLQLRQHLLGVTGPPRHADRAELLECGMEQPCRPFSIPRNPTARVHARFVEIHPGAERARPFLVQDDAGLREPLGRLIENVSPAGARRALRGNSVRQS